MFVQANGIEIYYERQGAGQPLLLLHGNSETHAIFRDVMEELSGRYCVYALDTRCHGQSSQGLPLSYQFLADDVTAFIAALGLTKPLALGFSDGAITALTLAIQSPGLLKGLVACGANTQPYQLRPWFLALVRAGYYFTRDPKLQMMYTQPDISVEDLGRIRVPVLVLAGTRDILPVADTIAIASAIPGAQWRFFPGHTHDSYLKQTRRLLGVVRPFLRDIEKMGPAPKC